MVTEYGRAHGEKRRYIQYSIFGWSLPAVIILINFIDYTYNIFPEAIHLVLGDDKCVYENIGASVYSNNFSFLVFSRLPVIIFRRNVWLYIPFCNTLCSAFRHKPGSLYQNYDLHFPSKK